MKFLVDRCAGSSLSEWLNSQGHDSVYAGSFGADPGDKALLQRAVIENRILISIDTDFGRIVFKCGEVHCGLVRLPDVRKEKRIELMKIVIERYGLALEKGAIITVRGNKIRVSLPEGIGVAH